jgi:DNA-binding Lrp family transcriptional regulator
MVRAYIMIKARTGEANRLREEIEAIDGVIEAHVVAGDVDLIASVDVDGPTEVKDVAATQIQDVGGIENTRTYIAMD